jgi:predicted deacylase
MNVNHIQPIPINTYTTYTILRRNSFKCLLNKIDKLKGNEYVKVKILGRISNYPIHEIELLPQSTSKSNILITSGVHGNESQGVSSAMLYLDQLLNQKREHTYYFVPVVNPIGYNKIIRRNGKVDLNRSLNKNIPEIDIIKKTLDVREYGLFLDLHGARNDKFFLIHNNSAQFLKPVIRQFIKKYGKLNLLKKSKNYKMNYMGVCESKNKNTMKSYMSQKGIQSITIEAPRKLYYDASVSGQAYLLNLIINEYCKQMLYFIAGG